MKNYHHNLRSLLQQHMFSAPVVPNSNLARAYAIVVGYDSRDMALLQDRFGWTDGVVREIYEQHQAFRKDELQDQAPDGTVPELDVLAKLREVIRRHTPKVTVTTLDFHDAELRAVEVNTLANLRFVNLEPTVSDSQMEAATKLWEAAKADVEAAQAEGESTADGKHDETDHLLSSKNNRDRLLASIAQLQTGQAKVYLYKTSRDAKQASETEVQPVVEPSPINVPGFGKISKLLSELVAGGEHPYYVLRSRIPNNFTERHRWSDFLAAVAKGPHGEVLIGLETMSNKFRRMFAQVREGRSTPKDLREFLYNNPCDYVGLALTWAMAVERLPVAETRTRILDVPGFPNNPVTPEEGATILGRKLRDARLPRDVYLIDVPGKTTRQYSMCKLHHDSGKEELSPDKYLRLLPRVTHNFYTPGIGYYCLSETIFDGYALWLASDGKWIDRI